MIKKLYMQISGARVLAAEFSLNEDGALSMHFHRPEAERLINGGAVSASSGRPLYPDANPKEFFDRLAKSFSRSTYVHVEDDSATPPLDELTTEQTREMWRRLQLPQSDGLRASKAWVRGVAAKMQEIDPERSREIDLMLAIVLPRFAA